MFQNKQERLGTAVSANSLEVNLLRQQLELVLQNPKVDFDGVISQAIEPGWFQWE